MVKFYLLTEIYASCFVFEDYVIVCFCLMSNFSDTLLQLTLCSLHIFWSGSDAEVINIKVILNSRSETRSLHFFLVFWHPQTVWWLLRSNSSKWSLGICYISLFILVSLMWSCGGMWMLQMFIGLCRVVLTAITWRLESTCIWCWGMSFLTRIDTSLEALFLFFSQWLYRVYFFNLIVFDSFRNVSWK